MGCVYKLHRKFSNDCRNAQLAHTKMRMDLMKSFADLVPLSSFLIVHFLLMYEVMCCMLKVFTGIMIFLVWDQFSSLTALFYTCNRGCYQVTMSL